MRQNITACLLGSLILFGCASSPAHVPPPYAVPPDVPYAYLASAIQGAYDHYESININVLDGNCGTLKRTSLFYIRKSASFPAGAIKVAAYTPLRLEYSEVASGGRTCDISMEVTLEPGKNYSIFGGFNYKEGPIPIFTGTRRCVLGVKDDAANMPVPYNKVCSQ